MITHRRTLAFMLGGLLVTSVATARLPVPDAPFVPTPDGIVDGMLRLAQVEPGDVLYDLGAGDGRIVIAAAQRYGARGVGIDIDPERVRESYRNAALAGVSNRVRFIQGDLFTTDIRPATVVTLYLLSSLNEKLRQRLLEQLQPGTRVASHAFDMGDWQPDARMEVEGAEIFLWIIPAEVSGRWTATARSLSGSQEFSISLDQQFQHVSGMVTLGDTHATVESGLVQGEQLDLVINDGRGDAHRLHGHVDGNTITGWVYAGTDSVPSGRWQAKRVSQ